MTITLTDADRNRSQFYADERQRQALASKIMDPELYLEALELDIRIETIVADDLERMTQLQKRTSQFTLGTGGINWKLPDVNQERGQSFALKIWARDKFSDYGLIGGVWADSHAGELNTRAFFISCRALGRNIEFSAFAKLIEIAEENKCSKILFAFTQTQRNIPMRKCLQRIWGQSLF